MRRWLALEMARNDASLLFWYPLVENLNDHAGNGYNKHLVASGNGGFRQGGYRVGASPVSYLQGNHGNSIALSPSSPFTLSCWYAGDTAASGGLVSFNDSMNALWLAAESGSYRLQWNSLGAPALAAYAPAKLPTGSPDHVVCTYDGTSTGSGVRFYLNGRPAASVPFTGFAPSTITTSGPLLGTHKSGFFFEVDNQPDGAIRGVRGYNRALPPNEVADLYRRESNYRFTYWGLPHTPSSGGFNLFVWATTGSGLFNTVPLYASGDTGVHNSCDLYVRGASPASGSFTLYSAGVGSESGSATLYTCGILGASSSMPLVVRAATPSAASGTAPLTVTGSTAGRAGLTKVANLFVQGGVPSGSLNLFLCSPSRDNASGGMNLFVGGAYSTLYATAPLVVSNNVSGVNAGATLFVQGLGTTAGSLPTSGSMNLYLKRPFEFSVPLYVQANSPVSGVLPLYVKGGIFSSGTVPMTVIGRDTFAASSDLFVSGF